MGEGVSEGLPGNQWEDEREILEARTVKRWCCRAHWHEATWRWRWMRGRGLGSGRRALKRQLSSPFKMTEERDTHL